MARTRELYMNINVAGRNFERSNEILTLESENTIEVLDAYFAETEIKKVYEGKEETYTVKSGDTLERIATKKGTTVEAIIESDPNITEQNKSSIQIGQKITFSSQTEKGENITFKRLSKASIGKEVYIVIKTKDFENEVLKINVKQGKKEGIVAQNEAIPLSIEDERKVAIETTIGNLCSTDYLNKDNYCNMAIIKVRLDPANEDDLESWQDKLKELENKKTFLYLLVDAHSNNADKEVIYHGRNPDADGNPDTDSMKNHWLDMEGKWFELKNACSETWDIATNTRINELHPKVKCPAKNFINTVESELGIKLRVTSGYRSFAEQTELYNKGRTTSGNVVTNANAGQSYHNYGVAIDVVEIKDGSTNWNGAMFDKIAPYAKAEGFEWGGDWTSFVDKPHFQITNGNSTTELKTLYDAAGSDYTKIKL